MVTAVLAKHIASASTRHVPTDVGRKAALHVIDTIAAMVSGTRLAAGRKVLPFTAALGGAPEASVVGSAILTNAHSAALANGMLAHADETDDSHAESITHPGCSVVPAALATAERLGVSGWHFLRAVIVGYDVGPRIAMALGGDKFFERGHSTHGFGGTFGAVAASCAAAGHDEHQAARGLAYAVQMASGNTCWRRDLDHIEKAFDFGGMPAHDGALAERMVSAGFTGSADPLGAEPGLFSAFSLYASPGLAISGLGERFEIMHTAIKKWSVGSPIQAALDSVMALLDEDCFDAPSVERITVSLPYLAVPVVDGRHMPAINLQHQVTVLIHEGSLTFASSHDEARFVRQDYRDFARRVHIEPGSDQSYVDNPRQAAVTIEFADGRSRNSHTQHVRGTPQNPMTAAEVVTKAIDLMVPVLGSSAAETLVDRLLHIEAVADVRELRPLWTPTT